MNRSLEDIAFDNPENYSNLLINISRNNKPKNLNQYSTYNSCPGKQINIGYKLNMIAQRISVSSCLNNRSYRIDNPFDQTDFIRFMSLRDVANYQEGCRNSMGVREKYRR